MIVLFEYFFTQVIAIFNVHSVLDVHNREELNLPEYIFVLRQGSPLHFTSNQCKVMVFTCIITLCSINAIA